MSEQAEQKMQRSRMEIVRDIDRVEYRLTSMGTKLQWEMLTPILDDLYAELAAATPEAEK